MRTLSVSLILVVLIATIGLSWLFDTLYLTYQQDKQDQPNDTVVALETVATNLARSLALSDKKQPFVQQWQGDYDLQLVKMDELSLPQALASSLRSGLPLTLESEDLVSIHVLIPESDELLLLEFPQSIETEKSDVHRYWLTSLFYALLIGVFLVWLTPLLQRLFKLRKAAKAFGEGQLDQRIGVGSISYIKDVESEFNHMAQRIEDLVADVKLLSSAVSHDLRTPLAKLRMGLDTLSEESDPLLREKYHKRLDAHLDNMVELVETLLQYARMDQAMIQLSKQPVSLVPLIDNYKSQQDQGIQLMCELSPEQTRVMGDLRYLKIAINNLIQNATKYGESQVLITITQREQNLHLVIEDDGDGIPPDQHESIFKPFVRGTSTKGQKGFGVGLAVVKRVLDWHNASIAVDQSKVLGGARFEMIIKKAP